MAKSKLVECAEWLLERPQAAIYVNKRGWPYVIPWAGNIPAKRLVDDGEELKLLISGEEVWDWVYSGVDTVYPDEIDDPKRLRAIARDLASSLKEDIRDIVINWDWH